MAKYRKLGRTSNQRKALLRNQVTQLLYHGKIRTTEAKAKEIRKIAEGLIALGVKEKDNFEVVKVQAKVILLRRFLMSTLLNTLTVTVVTQELLRLLSVKVMLH